MSDPRAVAPQRLVLVAAVGLLLPCIAGCEACEGAFPRTGMAQIRAQPTTGCSLRQGGMLRATDDRAASVQPSLAMVPSGHVLAWVDDRDLAQALYVQVMDPQGQPQGVPRQVPVDGNAHRPRVAAAGEEVVLIYGDLDRDGSGNIELQVLGDGLEPLLAEPRVLGQTDLAHSPGLTHHDGSYLAAIPTDDGVTVLTIRIEGASSADAGTAPDGDVVPSPADAGSSDGGDGGAPPPTARIAIAERTVSLPENVPPLGNVSLLFQGGRLYMAADTPEGWSIALLELGQDSLRKVSQVIDDRRHPDLYWCCPVLGPIRDDQVAVLWQGPTPGLTSLHFLGYEADGTAMGRVVLFEAFVREAEREGPVGRAPAFDPAIARAPYGLITAFSDNRYANSEVLLAPLTCTE